MRLVWLAAILVSAWPTLAQPIRLELDTFTVNAEDITGVSCLQIPVYIVDPAQNRDLTLLSFTLDITGDTHIIDGGVTSEMLVVNSFFNVGDPTGIANPPIALVNQAGFFPQPNCPPSATFNPASQGSGTTANFFTGTGLGSWAVNNNRDGMGRKFALVLNPGGNPMGQTSAGNRLLVGVLVVPIIANPGAARINIRATPEALFPSGNAFSWRVLMENENGDTEGILLSDLMDISQAEAVIDILQGGLPVPVLGPAGLIAFIAILLITALFLTRRGQVQGA